MIFTIKAVGVWPMEKQHHEEDAVLLWARVPKPRRHEQQLTSNFYWKPSSHEKTVVSDEYNCFLVKIEGPTALRPARFLLIRKSPLHQYQGVDVHHAFVLLLG